MSAFELRAFLFLLLIAAVQPVRAAVPTSVPLSVPVLVYHRFGPTVADSMTTTTPVFEAQLAYIKEHGYRVIPLTTLVAYLRGEGPPPPPRSLVITADDGHRGDR